MDLPYHIYLYYKGNELVGGMANFDNLAPLTPFQGILLKDTTGMKDANKIALSTEVTKALLPYCPNQFYNHYTFNDIRPFKWAGWDVDIRYTYVVDLTDLNRLWVNLEKKTRYEVTHAQKDYLTWVTPDFDTFNVLYSETFKRKGLERPITRDLIGRLVFAFNAPIFATCTLYEAGSMAIMIEDNKRAYYILGASDGGHTSSLTLWDAFRKLGRYGTKEIDLVGCNSENVALFKRGFGGRLFPYFGVRRV